MLRVTQGDAQGDAIIPQVTLDISHYFVSRIPKPQALTFLPAETFVKAGTSTLNFTAYSSSLNPQHQFPYLCSMRNVHFEDLGVLDYQEAWDYQEKLFGKNVDSKLAARKIEIAGGEYQPITEDYLLFVEHPHVYTLGKSGSKDNLLIDEAGLEKIGATYLPINRGGDITYHGYGQLVGYPIFDLEHYFTDIHKFLRYLEQAIINTIADYGIVAGRIDGLTGVWVEPDNMERARKICAMGIRCSRWVTMHGFALNVNTDLKYFEYIVPCGIDDKAVTSMKAELGYEVSMDELKERVKFHLSQLFSIAFEEELSI